MNCHRTYRHDPAWVFTLRLLRRTSDEETIVIRAFEVFEHPDRTRDHLTVEVLAGTRRVFPRGQLWAGSPVAGWPDGIDGRAARDAVLSLIGMAPGDTDADYFAEYTGDQREWASANSDRLWLERERRYAR